MGDIEFDLSGMKDEIQNAIARLSTNLDPHSYDLFGMGLGEDITGNRQQKCALAEVSNQILRSNMSNLTVQHFDLAFHIYDLIWVCRYRPYNCTVIIVLTIFQ